MRGDWLICDELGVQSQMDSALTFLLIQSLPVVSSIVAISQSCFSYAVNGREFLLSHCLEILGVVQTDEMTTSGINELGLNKLRYFLN